MSQAKAAEAFSEPTEPDLPAVKTRAKRKFVYANGSKRSLWTRFLALFGVCFMFNCAPPLPNDYAVTLDSQTLSPENMQAASDAVDEWQAWTPGLGISAHIAPCTIGKGYGEVCIMAFPGAPPDPDLEANTIAEPAVVYWTAGSTVRLWPSNFQTDSPARLIEHELGHAMGLIHTGPGTLMCAHPECSTQTVTAADVEQWEAIRQLD